MMIHINADISKIRLPNKSSIYTFTLVAVQERITETKIKRKTNHRRFMESGKASCQTPITINTLGVQHISIKRSKWIFIFRSNEIVSY